MNLKNQLSVDKKNFSCHLLPDFICKGTAAFAVFIYPLHHILRPYFQSGEQYRTGWRRILMDGHD
jgi:hypothetical protein